MFNNENKICRIGQLERYAGVSSSPLSYITDLDEKYPSLKN